MRNRFGVMPIAIQRLKVRNPAELRRVLVILAIAFSPAIVGAAESSGALDPSFGSGGKVIDNFGGAESVTSLVLQPDGKIIAAGGHLARYNTDGTRDTSFGNGGTVLEAGAGAVALQRDGKIVAVGPVLVNGLSQFLVTRFNNDGALDTTFGTGGRVITNIGGGAAAPSAVLTQPDGRIVAVGTANIDGGTFFALARYNNDGSLDTGFGNGGTATTTFGLLTAARSAALQPDGKIVVAGQAVPNGNFDFAVARYNSDGTLDASFGTGGKVTTDIGGGTNQAFAADLQPSGKIVVAGRALINGNFDFALARYNSDGTLDTGFGAGGAVTTNIGLSFDLATAVAVMPNGKIVAGGQTISALGGFDFGLARYNSDGTLDTSFGAEGIVITDFAGRTDRENAIVIQPDGRIIAAGQADVTGDGGDFALVRYN